MATGAGGYDSNIYQLKEHWTTKGRVIYDRKKHEFNVKDLIRIGKKLTQSIFFVPSNYERDIFSDVEKLLANAGPGEVLPAGDVDFGGGSFGGGGASGYFGDPKTKYKIVIIIEEN